MFLTDASLARIEQCLQAVAERARWLQGLSERPAGWSEQPETRWAAERALHVGIECVTDAANELIDALVMREPGGYVDILRVLMEEGVLKREWFERFTGALNLRQDLVRHYLVLEPRRVEQAAREYSPMLLEYVEQMQAYIQRERGL
ncbi:MAG: DUF86 domain-containing protein [Alicyclobacillus shizuokensis]|nr:DUF86 domain-containing protein [Alicyclobacillus shizuokensis]